MCIQMTVEVLGVTRVEEDVPAAYSGDNVKLRLKGIEEEVRLKSVCVCVCERERETERERMRE